MDPRRRSALLWGAVGALSFLVLYVAYLGIGGAFLGVGAVAGVAGVVFAASAVASHYAESRLGGGRFGGNE